MVNPGTMLCTVVSWSYNPGIAETSIWHSLPERILRGRQHIEDGNIHTGLD